MAFTINKPANERNNIITNLSQLPENLPKPLDVAVHYPVFPSDTDVDWAIEYLKSNKA